MCIEQILSITNLALKNSWDFANSTFFTSLIGAFAGAYGGQYIVERIKNRENLLAEIRNTNAAIMMAFDICNSYLSLKKQHVKTLKENHDRHVQDLNQFHAERKQGTIADDVVFRFQADFQSLETMLVPIGVLQKLIFEKISLNGRPLNLTATLIRTIQSLNNSIQKRNQLIELYKANSPIPDEVLATHYFGLPDKNGHIDNIYPSCVQFIYEQTDDCIFFSKLLCEDLVTHGEQLKKKFGKKSPKINKPDFQKAVDAGLMPDKNKYSDWKTMFVKRDDDIEKSEK